MCTDRSPEVPAASPVRKKFDLQSTFFKVMCTDRSPEVPAASPVRKKFDLQSTFLKLCVLIEARKFLQLLLSVRSLIYRVLFKVMCTDRSPAVPAASPVRKKFDLQSTF